MLSPTADTIRLTLHVLAATVWVGGQLTLAGLVPGLREVDAELPRKIARRFNRIAWPAFGVLVITGIWSILVHDINEQSNAYNLTLMFKLLIVAISGLAAFVHSNTRSRIVLAIGGALSGLSAIAAVFVGVLLASGN
jgi:putative copper export protein